MGFSIEKFFSDLQTLLDNNTMNAAKKVKAIKKLKAEAEAYAKACNAIPK